ncbi:MAG: hypothetical protein QOF72_1750, partial [Blastocatellia bacterium]|nr:hypothetical protein [Blastocatellia bacterium]
MNISGMNLERSLRAQLPEPPV